MKKKTALIFGITGQDGSYLAELLLKKNYIVNGVKRRSSSINTSRVDHIYQDPHEENYRFRLHYGDITDSTSVSNLIKKTQPDEIYNLAAQSHVAVSFEVPEYTANADALGALRILEAIKFHKPLAVINAAAYTAVDEAESEEYLANTINGDAPGAMAVSCAELDIPFVHISTDYVFNGEKSLFTVESFCVLIY